MTSSTSSAHSLPRRSALIGGLSVLSLPLLAACLGGERNAGADAPDDGSDGSGGSASTGPTPVPGSSDQGITRRVATAGAQLDVTVGPASVAGDTMLVPLAVHLVKAPSPEAESMDDGELNMGAVWDHPDLYLGYSATGVRLVDFDAGTVQETFKSVSEEVAVSPQTPNVVAHALFKTVESDTVNVMVPETGLFEGVPVVRNGQLSVEDQKLLQDTNDIKHNADPVALETFTTAADGSSNTRVTQDSVTVTLAADVLFDSDSADLSGQSDTTLKDAADQLADYSGGEITITGHTDDVADDAHNQELSEKRAQAVSDRLGGLTDMSAFTVTSSGKGETEPRVPNDSDENRQLNRRVEIVLVPTKKADGTASSATPGTTKSSSATGSLPAAEGPTAKGSEGVTVAEDHGDGQATFTLTQVTRRGGYLYGEITAGGGPGGTGPSGLSKWLRPTTKFGENARGESSKFALLSATTGLTLLTPETRYYPVDYVTTKNNEQYHTPLTELDVDGELVGGDSTTLTVVWPDTGEDTVTLDVMKPQSTSTDSGPFRLTDIPVV